ncbi:MAG: hypothetical protein LBR10_15945 [Prevotellaceae bacterium]|jgi:hypothetical protein|nr:hypothetical protein [Prevotellaceae bacterium]
MARKEINIFNVSFLDLLSGALGAVLILFIIIPKMTAEQQTAIEELERLQVEAVQLEELLEQARNSIPAELYEQIQAQMEAMQNTINELTGEVRRMQGQISQLERRNEQLVQQQRQTQEQLQQTQEQLARAQQQLEQMQPRGTGQGEKIFGVNAKLGIVCQWSENVDVDLYVKNLADNTVCCYRSPHTPFGNLNEDITSRTEGDDRYELFYQKNIIPGRYLVWVNIYRGSNPATIDGYIVMFPGRTDEQKIPYRQMRIQGQGQNFNIGILTVTETRITLTTN